jgi:hypothetical protein
VDGTSDELAEEVKKALVAGDASAFADLLDRT